jgi:hypothetical protein
MVGSVYVYESHIWIQHRKQMDLRAAVVGLRMDAGPCTAILDMNGQVLTYTSIFSMID